jgi:hypothetical protein
MTRRSQVIRKDRRGEQCHGHEANSTGEQGTPNTEP